MTSRGAAMLFLGLTKEGSTCRHDGDEKKEGCIAEARAEHAARLFVHLRLSSADVSPLSPSKGAGSFLNSSTTCLSSRSRAFSCTMRTIGMPPWI